ncbi:unnamed protein product, partial [Schistosoma rodhaini]
MHTTLETEPFMDSLPFAKLPLKRMAMRLIVLLLLSVFVFEHRMVETLSVSSPSEGPTVTVTEQVQLDNVTKDSESGYGSEDIDTTLSPTENNHTDASVLQVVGGDNATQSQLLHGYYRHHYGHHGCHGHHKHHHHHHHHRHHGHHHHGHHHHHHHHG